MWHVDEGTLHAYLDGALEEYPAAEAQRVRKHLDVCSTCRERLEAERRIRDDAAAILGLASPRVEAPTFEELRAYVRANAREGGKASTRLYRLGWAASLVLAVGAGWMLHGGNAGSVPTPPDAGPAPARGVSVPEVVPEAVPPLDARADVAAGPAPTEQPRQDARASEPSDLRIAGRVDVPSDTPVEPFPVTEPAEPVATPREVIADLLVTAPPSVTVSAPEVEPSATAQSAAPSSSLPTNGRDPVDDATPERRAVPGDVVTSAQVNAPPTGLVLGRTGGGGDARDEVAPDEESYSLVVPGLRVLDVRFRGAGTQPEGQVALQLLESGDTLQVIHLPPELSPTSLQAVAAGTNELVVQRSAGWIVMRAPLSEAELMELMTRLLAGP